LHPRDLDSWIGLAASYDRLRRFELADRAYEQAIKIGGATGEILNNRGYSYMLRAIIGAPARRCWRPRPRTRQCLHQEQSRTARGERAQDQGHPVAA
jgi:hypothetical protein